MVGMMTGMTTGVIVSGDDIPSERTNEGKEPRKLKAGIARAREPQTEDMVTTTTDDDDDSGGDHTTHLLTPTC